MNKLFNILFSLCLLSFLLSCQGDKKKTVELTNKAVIKLPAPFRHHEKIEIGPELIFDVYSWGRGNDSTSSILILRSDSIKNDFSVASTDNLDGRLIEVFNTDMDRDNNPEVLIYYTLNDKYNTAELICFEFTGKSVNKIRFPALTSKTKSQYRGIDKFYVKDAKLIREFNLFDEEDKEGENSMGKKKIEYTLKNNSFDLKEVE